MPDPQFPPGFGGQLPWQSPPQQPPAMGGPPPSPNFGAQPPPPSGPLSGLPPVGPPPGPPGAPAGAPQGALGAPAGQGNNVGAPPAPMQSPMPMAAGGRVPTLPRHAMQAMGIPMYADGGQVMPVMLSGRMGSRPGYAHGGLVQSAKSVKGAGRLGDSVLVHVNPKEFQEMQAKFGPHSINPETGLPEFGWLGDLLKVVAPIALMAIPGLGTAIGGAFLGAGAAGAGTLGSAILGAGAGALTGGGLKGALIGGLTGGIGANLPANIGGLSEGVTRGLEGAALGAGSSALGGGNALQGALLGGATGYLGSSLNGTSGNKAAMAAPDTSAYTDQVGVTHNGPSLGSIQSSPLAAADGAASSEMGGVSVPSGASPVPAPTAPGATSSSSGSLMNKALPALMLLSLAGGKGGTGGNIAPPGPPTPNLPSTYTQPFTPTPYAPQIDPEVLKLIMQNPNLYATMGGGGFYKPGTAGITLGTPKMAKGGALSQAAKHVSAPSPAARAGRIKGAGDGQSDSVNAQLATGEHVFDAATVALAGRGDNDAGHRRLEKLKQDIRREAGIKNSKKAPMMKEGALASAFKRAK